MKVGYIVLWAPFGLTITQAARPDYDGLELLPGDPTATTGAHTALSEIDRVEADRKEAKSSKKGNLSSPSEVQTYMHNFCVNLNATVLQLKDKVTKQCIMQAKDSYGTPYLATVMADAAADVATNAAEEALGEVGIGEVFLKDTNLHGEFKHLPFMQDLLVAKTVWSLIWNSAKLVDYAVCGNEMSVCKTTHAMVKVVLATMSLAVVGGILSIPIGPSFLIGLGSYLMTHGVTAWCEQLEKDPEAATVTEWLSKSRDKLKEVVADAKNQYVNLTQTSLEENVGNAIDSALGVIIAMFKCLGYLGTFIAREGFNLLPEQYQKQLQAAGEALTNMPVHTVDMDVRNGGTTDLNCPQWLCWIATQKNLFAAHRTCWSALGECQVWTCTTKEYSRVCDAATEEATCGCGNVEGHVKRWNIQKSSGLTFEYDPYKWGEKLVRRFERVGYVPTLTLYKVGTRGPDGLPEAVENFLPCTDDEAMLYCQKVKKPQCTCGKVIDGNEKKLYSISWQGTNLMKDGPEMLVDGNGNVDLDDTEV